MIQFTNIKEGGRNVSAAATAKKPDQIDRLLRYEKGDLTDEETTTLFQEIIDNGMAFAERLPSHRDGDDRRRPLRSEGQMKLRYILILIIVGLIAASWGDAWQF